LLVEADHVSSRIPESRRDFWRARAYGLYDLAPLAMMESIVAAALSTMR
jgi:hypothetical protein